MNSPFNHMCCELLTREQIIQLRVDRDSELNLTIDNLIHRGHNVLIYGSRGVGKSFFLRLLEHAIMPTKSLAVIQFRVSHEIEWKDEEKFANDVLMAVCYHAWKEILGHDYIDLRESIDQSDKELKVRSKPEKAVERVYSLLMNLAREVKRRAFSEFGASLALKGTVSDEVSKSTRIPDLLPFECFELCEYLLEKVYRQKGYDRLVLLCDEANTLPALRQEAILAKFFQGFRQHRVQFVFVAGVTSTGDALKVPDKNAFETVFELKPFSELSETKDVVLKHAGDASSMIDDHCIELVHEYVGGHPRKVLELFRIAHNYALYNGKDLISPRDIVRAIRETEEYRYRHHEPEMDFK